MPPRQRSTGQASSTRKRPRRTSAAPSRELQQSQLDDPPSRTQGKRRDTDEPSQAGPKRAKTTRATARGQSRQRVNSDDEAKSDASDEEKKGDHDGQQRTTRRAEEDALVRQAMEISLTGGDTRGTPTSSSTVTDVHLAELIRRQLTAVIAEEFRKIQLPAATSPSSTMTSTGTLSSSTSQSSATSQQQPSMAANPNTSQPSKSDLQKIVRDLTWQPTLQSDGSRTKVSTFLAQFELRVRNANGTEKQMLELLPERLRGLAFEWWHSLPPGSSILSSWTALKADMLRRYQPSLPYSLAVTNLENCKRRPTEDFNTHYIRFTECVSDLQPGMVSERFILNAYVDSLGPELALEVRRTKRDQLDHSIGPSPKLPSLAEVCHWAASADRDLKLYNVHSRPSAGIVTSISSSPPRASPNPNYKGKNYDPNYQPPNVSRPHTSYGSGVSSFVPSPHPSQRPTQTERATPAPVIVSGQASERTNVKIDPVARSCWKCGQTGHYKSDCTNEANPKLVKQLRVREQNHERRGNSN